MKHLYSILLPLVLLTSCTPDEHFPGLDPHYPSVYRKMGESQYLSLRNDYISGNYYVWTSINRFGFCDIGEDLVNQGHEPAVDTTVTGNEAVNIAKVFLLSNSRFTGIEDTSALSFRKINLMSHYYDGSKGYRLISANQFKDTIEVLSAVYLHVRNRSVVSCTGNWFPDIYLPPSLNYSEFLARFTLHGREVTHYGFGGDPYVVTITRKDLENCRGKLYFLPRYFDDRIEIRLVWMFNIPSPVYYEIYVDAMTGEVVSEGPTIIS